MTCQESEQYIQDFVDDALTGERLEVFLWHISTCKTCYNEMETSYLLKEALARLEDGTSFDLHSELKEKIQIMEQYIRWHNLAAVVRRLILTVAGLFLVWEMMYLYLYYL
ncbi:MAG: zf-HC2 domain-containing protein [Lachnospiraceae bacterium]|nr:zf-HC2 domain-containing protein [Lachnospiraceae bacterium]